MTDRRWAVTCDPGVDDAVALAAAAGRADCDVRAVVAGAGNVDAPTAWRNAAGLAALFGLDVPVGLGSAVALDGRPLGRDDHRDPHGGGRHGRDGLAGLSDWLPEVSGTSVDGAPMVHGRVVALGPLTDVARSLRAGRPLDRVVWMGGTIGWQADTTPGPASPGGPAAEFNACADVAAVEEVLASRLDLSIVPVDVTRQVTLDGVDLDRWDAGPAAAHLCAALARARRRAGRPVLHDPVAVVAALEPDLFTWQVRPLRCSGGDEHPRGALVPDPEGGGPARVAVAVDAPAVRRCIVRAVLTLGG